jgi:hypothetical protein
MKKLIFAAALMSLALLGGCAKGGSGPCAINCPSITIEPNLGVVGLNVSVPLTLVFVNATASPVNWALQPTSCGSACGTLTNVTTSTATYIGPASIPSNSSITIVATSQTDGSITGSLPLTIIPVTTSVAPVSPNVEAGLTQEFTSVAEPDQAPQTFTWTCTVNGAPCANFSQDPNISGLAYYKPTPGEECSSSGCVTISTAPTIDPTGCTADTKDFPCVLSQTTAVSSRIPAGPYAFEFSGYDGSGKAIAVAGTFTVDSGGSISGYEDELTAGGLAKRAFSGGSYNPINGSNVNSNNSGTLSLNTGAFPTTYQVVLDGAGDIQMISSDGAGNSGSGFAEPAATGKFNKGAGNPATFAFGFTGVDSGNHRVGYAGILATNGVSAVTSGLIDANDNGNASNSVCSAAPCPVVGTYAPDGTVSNLWHMTLTSPIAMTFDFFVANGSENNNGNNPLYLYAISTDSNPQMLGTMTYQNPKITSYTNAALTGNSVLALTGAGGNVALVLGFTDGSSGGSGGSGNFTGTFDWNNGGAITSVPPPPVPPATSCVMPTICFFANSYVSTTGNTGRYTLQILGNPNTPVVAPTPFVLYASGATRGYLLDQSSAAVITGTMNTQTGPKANVGQFASSSATGTYAVATLSNSVPSIAPVSMNLLLTSPGSSVFNVAGVQNQSQTVSGSYTVGGSGNGTIALTSPAKSNYVIYGTTETTFFMIDLDSGVTSSMLYLAQ